MMKTPRNFLSVVILLVMIGSPFFSATYDVYASGGDRKIDSGLTNSLLNQGSIIDQPAQISTDDPVQLKSSSETGLTFEITVPWQALKLNPITVDNKEFVQVRLPGWDLTSEPGAPELPILTSLIGVPAGAGIELSVLPGRSHIYNLEADVLPKVTQFSNQQKYLEDEASWLEPDPVLVYEKDPEVYDRQVNYPGVLAEISQEGFLRQQRVAGVTVYPVQYSPSAMEITVYETLQVTVNFTGAVTSRNVQQELDSDAFENLLSGTLLNYDAARDWRLSTEISASIQSDTQISSASWAPPVSAWRVKVRETGMYQLTYAELQAAGLPVESLDPRSLQMFYLGEEVAIQVVGEADGVFDAGDVIRFYGEGIASKYTLDNVYWLTYGETTQGLRMSVKDGSPESADMPDHYLDKRHFEDNLLYIPKANVDENWLWKQLFVSSSTTFSYTFTLTAPVSSPAVVRVAMLGYIARFVNPDHHVKVYVNDVEVGEVFWDGLTWQILEATIPSGVLQAGDNTIKVTALFLPGLPYDYITYDNIFLDWIELDYASSFLAENNHLAFDYDSPGTWKFSVDGFTSDQVLVFDVTDPSAVKRFTGTEVNPTGLGFAVAFEDNLTSPTNYFAVEPSGYRQVQAIESDTPSNLQAAANGADHIIITPADFTAASTSLKDYRQSQGLRSMVVDVQDIYDEFNFGITDPAAIHDFLAYTYNTWSGTAPSFVVLMGDATYDPKNYSGYNTESYIPAYLLPVDPWMGETAADNRYVTISGSDTMPDMMLGRISINSAAEAQSFVDKIIEYESAPDGDWKNQVLAVADNMDAAGDFASLSDTLLSCCLPEDYSAEKIYFGLSPYTDKTVAQNAIKSSISAGKFIVNYIGHGATASWAGESLFHSNYVPSLTNAGKYPIAVVMACMDGYHIRPQTTLNYHAVGEVFTRAVDKGAIASWSATGEGVASGHTYLNQAFYNAVFQQNAGTVGEATLAGKLNLFSVGASPDLLDTYLLFGDPATVIGQLFRAADDTYSTSQDTPLSQAAPGILSNDIYSGEGSLSAVLVSNAGNGSVTLNANGSFTYTPSSGFTGTDSFTYYASDGALDSNTATVTITVTGSDLNQAPVLGAIGDKTVDELSTLSFTATAVDPDLPANTLTFSLEDAPSTASIDPVSGAFSWTPTEAQGPGQYTFTVKVCDDGTPILCDTEEITVTVSELNQAPVLGAIGDKTVDELAALSFTATATDPDLPANTLTFSLEDAPIGAAIDPATGSFSWTPTEAQGPGLYTFTVKVCDDGTPVLCDTEEITVTVAEINQAPVLGAIGDKTVDELSTLSFTATASDPDLPANTLIFSLENAPIGASINPATGVFAWTPTEEQGPGQYTFTVKVCDNGTPVLCDTEPITVTVNEDLSQVSIPLYESWNLVSFNLVPPSTAVADVLASIDGNYTLVYAWAPNDPNGPWLLYDPSAQYASDLTDIDHSMGFWIKMAAADTLVVTGTQPETTTIALSTGWNLVGYPAAQSQILPDALETNGITDYSLVMAYHAAESEPWLLYDPSAPSYVNDLTDMAPGWGYWVELNSSGTWDLAYGLP